MSLEQTPVPTFQYTINGPSSAAHGLRQVSELSAQYIDAWEWYRRYAHDHPRNATGAYGYRNYA